MLTPRRRLVRSALTTAVAVALFAGAALAQVPVRWKHGSYTSQQTGTALWTPATGNGLLVSSVDLQCGGTTAGTVTVWFGAGGDTTFTQGTDQPVTYFDCGTPSATAAPGKVILFTPPAAGARNFVLRVTTSAALTLQVIVYAEERR
jgi:hypothetical protein